MPPFFTNGVLPSSAALTGLEKLPCDVGDDSLSITPEQISDYVLQTQDLPNGQYAANSSTVAFEPMPAEVGGARLTVLELTGNLGADRILTMPPASNIALAIPEAFGGMTYVLRFVNASASAQKWTIAGSSDGSVSLAGTADIDQSEWREYVATFDAAMTNLALQSVGAGDK